jgi:hypothetical protein
MERKPLTRIAFITAMGQAAGPLIDKYVPKANQMLVVRIMALAATIAATELGLVGCDNVIAFADDELSDADAEQFRSHLGDCEKCRTTLAEAVELQIKIKNLPLGENK